MKEMEPATDLYRSEWSRSEREVAGLMPAWLRELRQAASTRFAELEFPTTQLEEWRQTDVTPIVKTPFTLARRAAELSSTELEAVVSWVGTANRLTFVNGYFSPELSPHNRLPRGVIAGSLAERRIVASSLIEEHLGRYAGYEDHPFVALNTAFLNDGAFLYLPPNVVVEEPILVVFVSRPHGEPTVSHPRLLIVAAPSSQATIVQIHVGLTADLYFTNAVTELNLGEDAVLDHHFLQQESRAAYHIAAFAVRQGRRSTFTSHSLAIGSTLARCEVRGLLADEGATCTLRGLYVASDHQHMDTHTRIDHAKPRCTSLQLYRGILAGQASGVFDGRILVRPDARKTNASQINNNLLLSDEAVIHTAPQFEIFADDVKCTHGATVGQLDRDALFYLRSRGLDLRQARRLMTEAFGSEAISLIINGMIRNRFAELLSDWTSRTYNESLPA